jgi:hypothetical protein
MISRFMLQVLRGGLILLFWPALIVAREDAPAVLRYRDALQLSLRSPDVQIHALRLQREKKRQEQTSTFLPAAPELDLSFERSQKQYPAGYFDTVPTDERMKGRSYEVGVRQQIDVSGSRSSLRKEAEHRTSLAGHMLRLEKLQARSRLREAYLGISIHGRMSEHLDEHTKRFTRLKAAFGEGYFDRRLGAYTSSALDMGIASLQADYHASQTSYLQSILSLRRELALKQDQPIKVEDYTEIPLPELPDEAHLIEKARMGLPVLLGRDRIAMAQAAEEMASRKVFPFMELFAATGRRELGNYSSPSFQNNVPERENFWRFGIRIPLGIFGPERMESAVAAADRQIAEEELKQLEQRLDQLVKQELAVYLGEKANYERLYRTFVKSEPLTQALESALISRRITYFEFWGEHERLHDILIRMGEARLKAAAALGRLEILTGQELE